VVEKEKRNSKCGSYMVLARAYCWKVKNTKIEMLTSQRQNFDETNPTPKRILQGAEIDWGERRLMDPHSEGTRKTEKD